MALGFDGKVSAGAQMIVFPATVSRLDIVQIAGQAVAEGVQNGVSINLQAGSSATQAVVLRARDFSGAVGVVVYIVPDFGPSVNFTGNIEMSTNPADGAVEVQLPIGVPCRVYAWTK
jgi:hypothetical protein